VIGLRPGAGDGANRRVGAQPTHPGGRRRREGAETGRVELSEAVLMRRRVAALVLAAVACALAAGAVELGFLWLRSSSVFVLRTVAIRGGTESERMAVRDAVARTAAGESLLAVSTAHVAGAIESVPTIHLASVDRDFPHTLRIRIVPERPVALAKGKGRWRNYRSVAAASGRVLRMLGPSEAPPSLPSIWVDEHPLAGGAFRSAANLGMLGALAARPPGFHGKVSNVQFNAEHGIVMQLGSGLRIFLGPPLALPSKLRSAAWVLRRYRTRADRSMLVYADVSAPNRPAVMPRGGYAATAGLGRHAKKAKTTHKSAQAGA
jgi:cell division protein FtsQ